MKKYTDDYNQVAKEVASMYDTFDLARQEHNTDIETLQDLIFKAPSSKIKYNEDYIIPAMYKLYDTLQAYINEIVYQNNENIFEAKGVDYESQLNTAKHKLDMINTLDDMGFREKMITAVSQYLLSGELICFVGLKQETKMVKRERQLEVDELGFEKFELGDDPFEVTKQTTYDGVDIEIIKGQDFVFDVTQKRIFNKAPKIIRKYLTINEVCSNDNFNISKEDKKYFRDLVGNRQPSYDDMTEDKSFWTGRTMTQEGQLEVLEYWGDFYSDSSNNEIDEENVVIVVVAGKVVRFEENPFLNCPIVYYATMEEPNFKRGISPLRVAITPTSINTNIINQMMDSLELTMVPTWLVPKGALKGSEIDLGPGGVIEYDANTAPVAPQKLDFSAGMTLGSQALQLLERQTDEATGISPALAGALSPTSRTATETNLVASGGSARINNIIDKIKNGFNLQIIKKIADLKANTEFDSTTLVVRNDEGKYEEEEIGVDVKQGDYKYTYIDTKTAIERQSKFNSFLQFAQIFLQQAPDLLNIKELFKYGASEQGVQNLDKFMTEDKIATVVSQFMEQHKIPREEKQDIKDKIAQELPQIMQQYMMNLQQTNQQPTGMEVMPTMENNMEQPIIPNTQLAGGY